MAALLLTLGGTLGWFTALDSRTNPMAAPPDGDFSVVVVDVFDPGLSHSAKRVGARNAAEKPGLARMLVMPVFVVPAENPGAPPTLLPAAIGAPGDGALVTMADFNGDDWVDATDLSLGGDGYFYYRHILAPGESTDLTGRNLFNEVIVADPLPEGYEGAHLVIQVKCEAVGIRPPDTYIGSWWAGQVPPDAAGNTLRLVYDALQAALGL